jgi:hypothetical protein
MRMVLCRDQPVACELPQHTTAGRDSDMARWQLQHGSAAHPFEQQTLRLAAVHFVLILTFLNAWVVRRSMRHLHQPACKIFNASSIGGMFSNNSIACLDF